MDTYWRDNAACSVTPGGGDRIEGEDGNQQVKRLTLFIETYCHSCPVAQECLDDSFSSDWDDARETVRGGYLPTAMTLTPRGRAPGSTVECFWTPKPPPSPLPAGYNNTQIPMLEKGVCNRGRHGILEEDDLVKYPHGGSGCKACRREKDRERYDRLKNSAKMAA